MNIQQHEQLSQHYYAAVLLIKIDILTLHDNAILWS